MENQERRERKRRTEDKEKTIQFWGDVTFPKLFGNYEAKNLEAFGNLDIL